MRNVSSMLFTCKHKLICTVYINFIVLLLYCYVIYNVSKKFCFSLAKTVSPFSIFWWRVWFKYSTLCKKWYLLIKKKYIYIKLTTISNLPESSDPLLWHLKLRSLRCFNNLIIKFSCGEFCELKMIWIKTTYLSIKSPTANWARCSK